MPDGVLTIKGVAALLELAENAVYATAQTGELSALESRGPWRTERVELDAQPPGDDGGPHE